MTRAAHPNNVEKSMVNVYYRTALRAVKAITRDESLTHQQKMANLDCLKMEIDHAMDTLEHETNKESLVADEEVFNEKMRQWFKDNVRLDVEARYEDECRVSKVVLSVDWEEITSVELWSKQ